MLQYQVRNLNICRHNRDIPYLNTWTFVTGLSNSPFWIPNKSRFERAVDAKSWSDTLNCTTSYGYPQDLNSTKELGIKSILQVLVNHWTNYKYFPRKIKKNKRNRTLYLVIERSKQFYTRYITSNSLSHLTLFCWNWVWLLKMLSGITKINSPLLCKVKFENFCKMAKNVQIKS